MHQPLPQFSINVCAIARIIKDGGEDTTMHALYLLTGLTNSDNDEAREDGMEGFQVWRDTVGYQDRAAVLRYSLKTPDRQGRRSVCLMKWL